MSEQAGMAIAERLGNWAHALSLDSVPDAPRHIARRCIIDTLAVTIAGSRMPVAKKIADHVEQEYRAGPCTIFGKDGGMSATGAALANGTAAHILDFDDTSYAGIVHGSAIILPALLAACERSGSTGGQLLESFVAASEVTYALGMTATDSHYMAGWWATGTLGAIGAAAGAGKLLGLDTDKLTVAIAFATLQAAGMGAMLGYNAKPILAGQAARRGLESALQAAQGHTAPERVFEHGRGFFNLMNNGDSDASALAVLGDSWRLVEPGIAVKIAPVCSAAQAAIVLLQRLIGENGLDPGKISSVRCEVPHLVNISLIYNRPRVPEEAQFSMPFALGCILTFGALGPEHISPDALANRELQAAMAKVTMVEAEDLNGPDMQPRYPECARVTVGMADGDAYSGFLGAATGMPENPLSDDALSDKFRCCASFAGWPAEKSNTVLSGLWEIEKAGAVTALIRGDAACVTP